jgi:hypothetical protein
MSNKKMAVGCDEDEKCSRCAKAITAPLEVEECYKCNSLLCGDCWETFGVCGDHDGIAGD